jgi:hypothetical protein
MQPICCEIYKLHFARTLTRAVPSSLRRQLRFTCVARGCRACEPPDFASSKSGKARVKCASAHRSNSRSCISAHKAQRQLICYSELPAHNTRSWHKYIFLILKDNCTTQWQIRQAERHKVNHSLRHYRSRTEADRTTAQQRLSQVGDHLSSSGSSVPTGKNAILEKHPDDVSILAPCRSSTCLRRRSAACALVSEWKLTKSLFRLSSPVRFAPR